MNRLTNYKNRPCQVSFNHYTKNCLLYFLVEITMQLIFHRLHMGIVPFFLSQNSKWYIFCHCFHTLCSLQSPSVNWGYREAAVSSPRPRVPSTAMEDDVSNICLYQKTSFSNHSRANLDSFIKHLIKDNHF